MEPEQAVNVERDPEVEILGPATKLTVAVLFEPVAVVPLIEKPIVAVAALTLLVKITV